MIAQLCTMYKIIVFSLCNIPSCIIVQSRVYSCHREHRFSHPIIHQQFEERYAHEYQRFTDPCRAVQGGAQLIEAAQAEQEQLKIQIREALAERSTNYLEVGCHKVRLSDFSSTRLDSKAIKAVAPDLYDQYSKTVTGTRLSIT